MHWSIGRSMQSRYIQRRFVNWLLPIRTTAAAMIDEEQPIGRQQLAKPTPSN
jgi:hypothetical protein